LAGAFAAWFDLLAVDLLGYALMGNHIHLVIRTRPDRSAAWTAVEVRRRFTAAHMVRDGRPCAPDAALPGLRRPAVDVATARQTLAHPGMMLRAVKEGFARRLNRSDGTAGHVWESRYQDIAVLDDGGALACLVYVDLNPFRAGLVEDPAESLFCSARHRRGVDRSAPDAWLAARLAPGNGPCVLDHKGRPLGSWSWDERQLADLVQATARLIRNGEGPLPAWARELLPRLGVQSDRWADRMGRAGMLQGNVLASHATRAALSGRRRPSDKSGLFGMD
jgi:hypothetical protein